MSLSDTILALATPPGRSGVAVIRISGEHAFDALASFGVALPAPRHAVLAALTNDAGEVIDKALALTFPAPHSFTGEDVVELQVHGSRAVINAVMNHALQCEGLRMAEPGEFARRAFIHGKMDLTEAEGLADLIDAETEAQRRQALRLMQGEVKLAYEDLRIALVKTLAHLEAYIDFPDEDIPETVLASVRADIAGLKAQIASLLQQHSAAERVRDGVRVAIIGAPNAGKSTLLNALAKRDAAIVSDIPGTTRDAIEVHLNLGGYAVILTDTAGLRESEDQIEQEGIRRSKIHAEHADIRLVMLDATAPGVPEMVKPLLSFPYTLIINNKVDSTSNPPPLPDAISLSARSGLGVEILEEKLSTMVCALSSSESLPMITRQRHRSALEAAFAELSEWSDAMPLEFACEHLRRAARHIGKITGKIEVDELLDLVFTQFCIGK